MKSANSTPLLMEVINVTPVIAARLLAGNSANRPMRDALVLQYAEDMEAGRWQLNGESVKVSVSGRLLDGQHRLRAVMLSNRTVEMLVVRGLPDLAFHTIDTGMRRTAAQIIKMDGSANAVATAAAARWIALIERGGTPAGAVSSQTVFDVIAAHPQIHVYASKFAGKQIRKLMTAACCSVFVLAAEKYGNAISDDFLNRFETGEGLSKGDPVYELRERLISSKARVAKLPAAVVVAITIKAVKAYASGKNVNLLRWSPAEEFPTL